MQFFSPKITMSASKVTPPDQSDRPASQGQAASVQPAPPNKAEQAAALQKKFAPLLAPLGRAYSGLMALRAKAYATGLAPSAQPTAPSIAVGNIAWGGAGKTPITDWLLSWAEQRGIHCIVISRGYGGHPKQKPLWVTPGQKAQESGDEPLMLARKHPAATVLVDPSRRRALRAIKKTPGAKPGPTGAKPGLTGAQPGLIIAQPGLIIFDDAMQHLAVKRDLNLVLLRPEDLLDQWGKVQPAGSWREGVEALGRASAFLLRAAPQEAGYLLATAENRLKKFARPLFTFYLQPVGLRRVTRPGAAFHSAECDAAPTSRLAPPISGKDLQEGDYKLIFSDGYILCCGVGSPHGVEASATELLGRAPEESFIFSDHYFYTEEDMTRMSKRALPIVCTEKDAVKLAAFTDIAGAAPLYSLESAVKFGLSLFTKQSFAQWLEEKMPSATKGSALGTRAGKRFPRGPSTGCDIKCG